MKKTKENGGITLVALVVTIVVLLILAGVSIDSVVGDNGIIKKAKEAAEKTKEAQAKEEISLVVTDYYVSETNETLEEFLKSKIPDRIDKVTNNNGTLTIEKDGYTLTVDNIDNSNNKDEEVQNKEITLSVTTYDGTYDGTEHDAITSVSVEPSDAKVEYSTDGGATFSTTIPKIKDTLTITIRASKAGYNTKTIKETLDIRASGSGATGDSGTTSGSGGSKGEGESQGADGEGL